MCVVGHDQPTEQDGHDAGQVDSLTHHSFYQNFSGPAPGIQYCGTVTIYLGSGSGSDFGKVSVPTSEKFRFRFRLRIQAIFGRV